MNKNTISSNASLLKPEKLSNLKLVSALILSIPVLLILAAAMYASN